MIPTEYFVWELIENELWFESANQAENDNLSTKRRERGTKNSWVHLQLPHLTFCLVTPFLTSEELKKIFLIGQNSKPLRSSFMIDWDFIRETKQHYSNQNSYKMCVARHATRRCRVFLVPVHLSAIVDRRSSSSPRSVDFIAQNESGKKAVRTISMKPNVVQCSADPSFVHL